jgi:hypothetical protein
MQPVHDVEAVAFMGCLSLIDSARIARVSDRRIAFEANGIREPLQLTPSEFKCPDRSHHIT